MLTPCKNNIYISCLFVVVDSFALQQKYYGVLCLGPTSPSFIYIKFFRFGASLISFGSLFQFSTTRLLKNCFLISLSLIVLAVYLFCQDQQAGIRGRLQHFPATKMKGSGQHIQRSYCFFATSMYCLLGFNEFLMFTTRSLSPVNLVSCTPIIELSRFGFECPQWTLVHFFI